jgi:hypothetical protein
MCKRLIHLMFLVLAFGLMGTAGASYTTVGVYDPDDEPYHNQVDQSGVYRSHTGDAGPENVIDLATFQALIGPAFAANAGGVVDIENTNGSLDGQDIIARFGAGTTKSLTISNISGLINTGSSVKEGRTPTSGRQRLAKSDTGNFAFAMDPLTGGQPGEVVTYFAGTMLDRDGANLVPVVTATFSGGGTVTAVATMSGDAPSSDQDTFFGFVAPAGQSIVKVDFDPTGGPYTNMDDLGFITSAFVVVSPEASNPQPRNRQVDVPRDVILSWVPGTSAQTHDVYFGTSFDDVNTASRTNPNGVLVSQNQEAATYDPPDLLAFEQTCYWRVDEVNAPPDSTIIKGRVWTFTAEPYAYPLENVTATASSAMEGMGPEKTVDGSGLNAADQHSTEPNDMWLSAGAAPNWIQYEFDRSYVLQELSVWNSNQAVEEVNDFGARSVKIETFLVGDVWKELPNVPEFARATGTPTYTANTTINFDAVWANLVKLTINDTWGGGSQSGLSEVRFSYLPTWAREPQPAVAATDVGLDVVLNWRPGRTAASHKVYFGTDKQAVTDGTAPAQTVTDHSFFPSGLLLGTSYSWKVDEVNETEWPAVWWGDVWDFSTIGYLVVDDFESYNDEENKGTRIYETWIDGWADNSSGSQVGYSGPPFAERATVHGGAQSMPLAYNNSVLAYSQADRTFAAPQDWTAHGAKALSLFFYGPSVNSPGQLYMKVNGQKVAYSGPAEDLKKMQWVPWRVELAQFNTDVQRVQSLAIGVDGKGITGTLFIDDIQLVP